MFTDYRPSKGYDEYFSAGEQPRQALQPLLGALGALGIEELNRNHAAAGMLLKRLGATFRLNDSGRRGGERILPFDPLPRLIGHSDWQRLQRLAGLLAGAEIFVVALGGAVVGEHGPKGEGLCDGRILQASASTPGAGCYRFVRRRAGAARQGRHNGQRGPSP